VPDEGSNALKPLHPTNKTIELHLNLAIGSQMVRYGQSISHHKRLPILFAGKNQGMTCVYPAVDDGKAFAIVRVQDLRRLMVH
jgi:hypothetical protein